MQRLLNHIVRHPKIYIAGVILITVIMGYFTLQVRINPDVEALVPEDDRLSELMEKYSTGKSDFDYIALAIESDNPFEAEILEVFYTTIRKIEELPQLKASANPFSLITFEMNGKKLEIVPVNPVQGPPRTEEDIELFRSRLLSSPFADQIISADRRVLCAYFPSEKIDDYHGFMRVLTPLTEELSDTCTTYLTGSAPFTDRIMFYLTKDLATLLSLGMLVILVFLYIGFRAKRAITLPISVVLMGTIWSLGFMGIFGFTLTVVSIVTPPLVLILGCSYSIHLLNQYYREAPDQPGGTEWISLATANIAKTILLAAFTTVIGFASLIPSAMRQTMEFGLSVSAGIAACALLSLFFLPAALSLLSHPKGDQKEIVTRGWLTIILEKAGIFVMKKPVVFAALLPLIAVLFLIANPHLVYQTNFMKYFPSKDRIIKDTEFINENISSFQQMQLTLTAPDGEKNYFLKPEVLQAISRFERELGKLPDVKSSISMVSFIEILNEALSGTREIPDSRGLLLLLSRYARVFGEQESTASFIGNLINPEFSAFTFTIVMYDHRTGGFIYDKEMAMLLDQINLLVTEYIPAEMNPEVWGNGLRFTRLFILLQRDQKLSLILSFVLVFLVSALFLRSFYCGLLALVPLATAVMLNFIFMVLFSIPLDMTTIMVASVSIGIGVDNSIHFLIQYQRQKKLLGTNTKKIILNTITLAGRPIVLTTGSIVAGLLILTFSSFKPISFFGFLISTALTSALFGTLFILPALLLLFSPKEKKTEPE